MQATFVKLEEANRIHLISLARRRGTTLSALIREAVFERFNLTSDGPLGPSMEQERADAVGVTEQGGS